jgi:hypothetical protein
MKFRVQVIRESDAGEIIQEVACLERQETSLKNIGISLAEAKSLLSGIQKTVVEQQTTDYLERQKDCPHCGRHRRHKGQHDLVFRTLFGNLTLVSPRLFHCSCRPSETDTFSPLTELFSQHVSPERLYLEIKWAAQVSYEMTAKLLADVLPLEEEIHTTSIRNHLHEVAERCEAEMGDEQFSFIEGCPRDWAALPRPAGPLTVGIDGGYVRHWDDKKTHFEVIVGKSMPDEGSAKCFGFVQTYDEKPKRRLYTLLKSQGLQMNQQIVFLSDGGETVRELQIYLSPEAEHYLDWFHITMRLTVMGQYAKGLSKEQEEPRIAALKSLERIKHYLWHGNVVRALDETHDIEMRLEVEEEMGEAAKKLAKAITEFQDYIKANERFIPNYGERWRNQEMIATGFVESTVNYVVGKRFVKKQQMQWKPRGAHLLLQMRTKVLNEELDQMFQQWYPNFRKTVAGESQKVA